MRARAVCGVLMLFVLAACGDRSWHGKDISHLMPPLEFELIDEQGQAVDQTRFAGRPLALYFGFTHCPDVCPMTLAKLVAAVRRLPPKQGERLQLAFVSVDPARDTPERLAEYTDAFSPDLVGLTGRRDQLDRLTRRYRVTYGYGEPDASGNYDVSHSSAIFVFNADLEPELMLLDSLSVDEIAADLARLLGRR